MIQFYINSRPVPRSIARAHLIKSLPYADLPAIGELFIKAIKGDKYSTNRIAEFGISIASI